MSLEQLWKEQMIDHHIGEICKLCKQKKLLQHKSHEGDSPEFCNMMHHKTQFNIR